MATSIRDPTAGDAGVTSGRTPRRGDGVVIWALLVLAVVLPAAATVEGPSLLETEVEGYGLLRWRRGEPPMLLVRPAGGEGWISLARTWTGGADGAPGLRAANPRLVDPMRDREVRVPLTALAPTVRLGVVRRLFPMDERVPEGWRHWPLDPFGDGEESWGWLAGLFAGRAGAAEELRRANPGHPDGAPQRGRPVVVPEALLMPVFREVRPPATPTPVAAPAPPPTPAEESPAGSAGPLSFGRDDDGRFAVYRLRAGEALYSAVVVRFTGQLEADQVNATAAAIARRSGIHDVTSIPIGFPVKIPVELLLPEHLPADDPRRVAWEAERRELDRFLEVVRAADLGGVHVVLDAGHGGADPGSVVAGVWEATYVYDLTCRVKRILERHTRATVWMTRLDRTLGDRIPDRDRLENRRDQYLLTRPTYDLRDSVIGVHLRWYLTNDIILNRLGEDVPRSKTVFVSIHADSLHPSVRGAMVYVPSRYMRPPTFTVRHPQIGRYQEYRNHPTVRLGPSFKARVEASSRHLAERLVDRFEANDVETHPYQPVRDRILRGRRSFVPAVLRYTAAQHAVLVEACNMANDADRALLLEAAWRERFARSVVEGISAAYDGAGG